MPGTETTAAEPRACVESIAARLQDMLSGRVEQNGFLPQLPRVRCVDGFTMSVQTGWSHYCSPRDNRGPWNQVEVGYPSEAEPLLSPWAEDHEHLTETVYGYTPLDVVAQVVAVHGGFASGNRA